MTELWNEYGIWIAFNGFVLIMLALDLGVFHRTAHVIKVKEAMGWSFFWISLALIFNVIIYFWLGEIKAWEFLTGYVIEKSLSVDNIFVIVMIFSFFHVPPMHQHRVLFWGILGALVMRAIFIAAGVTLIEKFHWMIYIFGAFLIITGIKMAFQDEKPINPEQNILIRLFRKFFPVSPEFDGGKFFTKIAGKTMATPMFIVLLVVEATDLLFAVDSIPAVLAVTSDPFIVYTSNVFAILGLRSLYFAVAEVITMFVYLKYGLSAVLTFVGIKMVIADIYKIPIEVSLLVIISLLGISVMLSILSRKKSGDIHPG